MSSAADAIGIDQSNASSGSPSPSPARWRALAGGLYVILQGQRLSRRDVAIPRGRSTGSSWCCSAASRASPDRLLGAASLTPGSHDLISRLRILALRPGRGHRRPWSPWRSPDGIGGFAQIEPALTLGLAPRWDAAPMTLLAVQRPYARRSAAWSPSTVSSFELACRRTTRHDRPEWRRKDHLFQYVARSAQTR